MKNRPLDYWLLWLVALASLAANAWMARALLGARRTVGEALDTAAHAVAGLRTATLDYPVVIDQSFPVSLTVPLNRVVDFPVQTTLPINTNVNVPLNTPLGTYQINVPVNASVPVSFTVSVPVRLDVPISTTVPVNFSVPVHLAVAGTPLEKQLAEAQTYLEVTSADLLLPLLPLPWAPQ